MKKIIPFILLLSLACAWLTGCKNSGVSDEPASSSSEGSTASAEKSESSQQESQDSSIDSYEDDTMSATWTFSDDRKTCYLEYTFKNKYDIYNNFMFLFVLSTDVLEELSQISEGVVDNFICTFNDIDGKIYSLEFTVSDGEISDGKELSELRDEYASIWSGIVYEDKIELVSATANADSFETNLSLSLNFFPANIQIRNLTDESVKSVVYLNVECEDGQFITIDGTFIADAQSTARLIVTLDDEQSEFLAEHKYKDCEIAAAVFA
ncbi:hypothetical protein [Ruminococcus sp. Marseille-P6503]|uniref:hypothetical protein n=1 Tax=Ruminococcus sp. Marseille-P6503 TaxID=2364796 RepID=UPI000F51C69D|nr:hypothetical protein [Ruminococcus sp. Marseille-P6503]